MRLNQWLARATGISRRAADSSIAAGQVMVNGEPAKLGQSIDQSDIIVYHNQPVSLSELRYVILNKPTSYICSRQGQGNGKTIYDLLPPQYFELKSVGRLDKDSSGLLLLTNDGDLANQLTHPSYQKQKEYELSLNTDLSEVDRQRIEDGIMLFDGLSQINLTGRGKHWKAILTEGRNRQIRRTFDALGYRVVKLHRVSFGNLKLLGLQPGETKIINKEDIV